MSLCSVHSHLMNREKGEHYWVGIQWQSSYATWDWDIDWRWLNRRKVNQLINTKEGGSCAGFTKEHDFVYYKWSCPLATHFICHKGKTITILQEINGI